MSAIQSHVIERILAAKIEAEPYPHFFIDHVFPEDFYQQLLAHLPSDDEFISPDEYRFGLELDAGGLTRVDPAKKIFWQGMCDWLLAEPFMTSMASLFYPHLKLRFFDRENVALKSTASLARSKSGFLLGPHTDMPHRVLSLIFYLPQDDQNWQAGTSIYQSRDGEFSCKGGPHHGFENFKKTATIRFIPNVVFGFLKSDVSFHGVEPWSDPDFCRNSLQYEIHDTDRAHYYG